MFISGGENIHPETIEQAICEHPTGGFKPSRAEALGCQYHIGRRMKSVLFPDQYFVGIVKSVFVIHKRQNDNVCTAIAA